LKRGQLSHIAIDEQTVTAFDNDRNKVRSSHSLHPQSLFKPLIQ